MHTMIKIGDKLIDLETNVKFVVNDLCVMPGTHEIAIYLKTGFGASERVEKEVIKENVLNNWLAQFKKEGMDNTDTNTNTSTFVKLRTSLFTTLEGIENNKISPEKAKSTCLVVQTVLNTIKVEIELNKIKK